MGGLDCACCALPRPAAAAALLLLLCCEGRCGRETATPHLTITKHPSGLGCCEWPSTMSRSGGRRAGWLPLLLLLPAPARLSSCAQCQTETDTLCVGSYSSSSTVLLLLLLHERDPACLHCLYGGGAHLVRSSCLLRLPSWPCHSKEHVTVTAA